MVLFDSGLFWFVEGILVCLTLLGLKAWMQDKHIPMPWWKWLLVCVWLILVGTGIAYVGTSLGENELQAARMGGLFTAVIAIISAVMLWRALQWK